ncbi:hypothetical protein BU17DRAFT_62158 [Hysterangium stoloniferum]|nr:hypothetical protein BU17DRAFT_62158 [Hysterangium stoloniferum]
MFSATRRESVTEGNGAGVVLDPRNASGKYRIEDGGSWKAKRREALVNSIKAKDEKKTIDRFFARTAIKFNVFHIELIFLTAITALFSTVTDGLGPAFYAQAKLAHEGLMRNYGIIYSETRAVLSVGNNDPSHYPTPAARLTQKSNTHTLNAGTLPDRISD